MCVGCRQSRWWGRVAGVASWGKGERRDVGCWSKQEEMAKVGNTTKVVHGEGEQLNVLRVEGEAMMSILDMSLPLLLNFAFTFSLCRNCMLRGTWGRRGRVGDYDIDGQVGGRVSRGAVEVGWGEEGTNVSRASRVVGN